MSNKNDRITIRIKSEDKKKIKMLALEKDMSVSEMFMQALKKYESEEMENYCVRS